MSARLISDLKILVNYTHVLQLLEDKPLTLLGKAPDFLMGQPLQKLPNGFGYPYGDNFRFLFHGLIIYVCSRLSTPYPEFIIDKCIHIHIIESANSKSQSPMDPIKRKGDIMKAAGYIRVSTEDQAREGISLENQEAKIRAYASINDLELVGVIHDEGASGKSLEREGIVRLLDLVESGKVEAVIVYRLDRLSERTLDTLSLTENFESKGIAFHSISEKVDTKNATGKFFLTIISAVAQMERDMIAERTKDALAHKRHKGEWTGRVPFGFRIEENRLVEDPEQIKVIQKAKRLRRSGKSLREISRALNLSLGYVHKALKVNLKTVKSNYSIYLNTKAVH